MELSRTVASMAIALGVILATGYAYGQESAPSGATKPTAQEKIAQREAQRREAMKEHQARKEEFNRRCTKPAMLSDAELEYCRAAYRKL
jgi:hypothetical protein